MAFTLLKQENFHVKGLFYTLHCYSRTVFRTVSSPRYTYGRLTEHCGALRNLPMGLVGKLQGSCYRGIGRDSLPH
jgi:hypothetical protein